MISTDLLLDVTPSLGLGEPANVAATLHCPAALPEGPVDLLFAVHGGGYRRSYWHPVFADETYSFARWFTDRGKAVLAIDMVGMGESSRPEPERRLSRAGIAAAHASALNQVIERLGRPVNVTGIGHSMGGMLATRYALNHSSSVEKLVLVNPVGLEDYLRYVEYKDPAFFYENEKGKTIDQIRAYQRKNYYDGKWSEDYEELIEIHVGWINGDDWNQVAWNNALTYDMIFTGNVSNEFDQLVVPTHLILGTRDTTGPGRGWKKEGVNYELGRYDKLGEIVVEQIPDGYLYELEGIGHMPQFEAFDRYREQLDKIF